MWNHLKHGVLFMVAMGAPALAQSSQPMKAHRWRPSELAFVTESEAKASAFGMLMDCPAHAHGTPDQAYEKLKNIIATRKDASPSTIWVCRANQIETLKRFAPLADRVCVNPFVALDMTDRSSPTTPWQNGDRPLLRSMREIIDAANGTPLYACMDSNGEGSMFAKRKPDVEEIRWQICAALGSGCKGIVWRGDEKDTALPSQLKNVIPLKSGLAAALPVLGAKVTGNCPISVLRNDDCIYVVILHPAYFCPRQAGDTRSIELPLDAGSEPGTVELVISDQANPTLRPAVFGSHARITVSGETLKLSFDLRLGGEIFVIQMR